MRKQAEKVAVGGFDCPLKICIFCSAGGIKKFRNSASYLYRYMVNKWGGTRYGGDGVIFGGGERTKAQRRSWS